MSLSLSSPPSPLVDIGAPPHIVDTGSGSPSTASAPSSTGYSPTNANSILIGIVVAVICVVALIIVGCIFWTRRRWKRRRIPVVTEVGYEDEGPLSAEAVSSGRDDNLRSVYVNSTSSSQVGLRCFSFEELSKATNNFNASELLGKGGFGPVYRGVLSGKNGSDDQVAVKCIAENSRQGVKEFEAELKTISELHHRNLVTLRGFCNEQGRLLLVYEYMANGSLDYHLFNDSRSGELSWKRRNAIATGLGLALFYLHEECKNVVIHRDVKSSNVLLDDEFNAKLGDFGLSRQVNQGITSYTTVLAGTQGYMGPELFMGGKASSASDMYAYGAVLLELVTGKRIVDARLQEYDGSLLYWVWDLYGKDMLVDAVDKRLAGNNNNMSESDLEEAKRVLVVGLACSHPEPKARLKIKRALDVLDGTVALPRVPPSRPTPSYGPLPVYDDDIINPTTSEDNSKPGTSATDSTSRTDPFSSNPILS